MLAFLVARLALKVRPCAPLAIGRQHNGAEPNGDSLARRGRKLCLHGLPPFYLPVCTIRELSLACTEWVKKTATD